MDDFKVDFIIPGTQKGGTTSAVVNLNLHPDVHSPLRECHFFNDKFEEGFEKYKEMLDIPKNFKGIVGEKTPSYCINEIALKRIKQAFPNIKIIFFIREPVSRLLSYVNHAFQEKYHVNPLHFIFNKEPNENESFNRGLYINQIVQMIDIFGEDNIKIKISERCRKFQFDEYNDIFEFLGVRKLKKSEFSIKNYVHSREYSISVSENDRKYLHELYKPHNEKLFKLLGYEIDEWQ